MSSERITQPVHETTEATKPENGESSRRRFLRQVAIAGAGVAGLTLLGEQSASAAGGAELILGTYQFTYDSIDSTLTIDSQSGNVFVGRVSDGSAVNGTISGLRPGAVTLTFNRLMLDGAYQIYVGAVATRPGPQGKQIILAGTMTHNGAGPWPWHAVGTGR